MSARSLLYRYSEHKKPAPFLTLGGGDARWRQTRGAAQSYLREKAVMLRLISIKSEALAEFDARWRQTRGAAQSCLREKAVMLRLLYHTSIFFTIYLGRNSGHRRPKNS